MLLKKAWPLSLCVSCDWPCCWLHRLKQDTPSPVSQTSLHLHHLSNTHNPSKLSRLFPSSDTENEMNLPKCSGTRTPQSPTERLLCLSPNPPGPALNYHKFNNLVRNIHAVFNLECWSAAEYCLLRKPHSSTSVNKPFAQQWQIYQLKKNNHIYLVLNPSLQILSCTTSP